MGEDGTDVTAAAPSGLRRLAPRSFRASIVVSTVGVMTVAMIVVVLGTYLVLERTANRDIQQVLDDRSRSVLAVLEQSADPVVASEDALQPGMVVYDASGSRVMGSVATPLRSSADDLARVREARAVHAGPAEDRLLATPFTTRAGESGVLVVSQEVAPYERSELYAFLAAVVLGVAGRGRHRRHGLARDRAGAQAGGRHGRAGRGLERARPRPPFRPGAPEQRARRARRDARPPARPRRVGHPVRAAAHLRARPRAPHAAHRDPGVGRPRPPPRRRGPGRAGGPPPDLPLRPRDVRGDHDPARPRSGPYDARAGGVPRRRPRARAGRGGCRSGRGAGPHPGVDRPHRGAGRPRGARGGSRWWTTPRGTPGAAW